MAALLTLATLGIVAAAIVRYRYGWVLAPSSVPHRTGTVRTIALARDASAMLARRP